MTARILANIVMSTSVHLPRPLLAALDRKARALRVSRNQLVIRALERELAEGSGWPTGFFERLAEHTPETDAAVDEMMDIIRKGRRSKAPPTL